MPEAVPPGKTQPAESPGEICEACAAYQRGEREDLIWGGMKVHECARIPDGQGPIMLREFCCPCGCKPREGVSALGLPTEPSDRPTLELRRARDRGGSSESQLAIAAELHALRSTLIAIDRREQRRAAVRADERPSGTRGRLD